MKLEITKGANGTVYATDPEGVVFISYDDEVCAEIVHRVNIHEELIDGYNKLIDSANNFLAAHGEGLYNSNFEKYIQPHIDLLKKAESKTQGEG